MGRIKSIKFELERAAAEAYKAGQVTMAMRLLDKAGKVK